MRGVITSRGTLTGSITATGTMSGKIQRGAGPSPGEVYIGPYEVTPSRAEQVLATNGKTMLGDVTIAAIPQNYGLITYNGFALTVS